MLFVLVIGGVVAARCWPKKQKETAIFPNQPPIRSEVPKEPSPPAAPPSDSRNGFNIGKISLQKTEGSGLVYAVGVVKNDLDRQRFGVKIELNLLDEHGQNLGVASDYVSVIEPHKEWQFKALLAQPGTAKVTVADIQEQP